MSKNVVFSYFTHLINKLYKIKWFETFAWVHCYELKVFRVKMSRKNVITCGYQKNKAHMLMH